MQNTIRIVGIDPGLRRTGWGIVEAKGNALAFIAAGSVTSAADGELAARLAELFDGLSAVVARHGCIAELRQGHYSERLGDS